MKRKDVISEKPAIELVMQLAAMANFPPERAAVEALAKALERAATDTGLRMQAILDDCLNGGAWCPTPYDLRNVATGMKQRLREKREGSKHAEWKRIYGDPNPQWASDLLAQLMAPTHAESRRKLHERAIRDVLYYTEGEGKLLGDRAYWDGDANNIGARNFDLEHFPELVAEIRECGGWRTERELQDAGSEFIPPTKQRASHDGRAAGANDR